MKINKHVFMKGRSFLSNPISFYDKVTHLHDEGRSDDVFYLDISKAFNTVPTTPSWRNWLLTYSDGHTGFAHLAWMDTQSKKQDGWPCTKSCGEWSYRIIEWLELEGTFKGHLVQCPLQ